MIRRKKSGVTILELVISCIVFSLFLFAAYSVLDLGLKSWQMGETKSDLHQKAEIVLNRIIRDFRETNIMTVQIDSDTSSTGYSQYICVETPVKSDTGTFESDLYNVGSAKWQGYVIYYIYPMYPAGGKKDLYRRFIPRATVAKKVTSFPTRLQSPIIYIDNDLNRTGMLTSVVVKDIYSIDFERNGVELCATVCFKSNIRENASVMFSPGGDSLSGTEGVEIKASTCPRN